MAEKLPDIAIFDGPGAWREDLEAASENARPGTWSASDSAADLKRALNESPGPKLIVVGQQLCDGDALDTLYLTSRETKGVLSTDSTVCWVTETRYDHDYLELMRNRGVQAFIYRDDLPDMTVDRINRLLERPTAPHDYPVNTKCHVKVGETSFEAALKTLSGTECQLVGHRTELPLSIGEWIEVSFGDEDETIECVAEVRSAVHRRRWLRRYIHIRAAFMFPEPESQRAIEKYLDALQKRDQAVAAAGRVV